MELGVSIALCTYNGVSRIEDTLKSIFTQDKIALTQVELLVIDNSSTDCTLEFCKSIINENNYKGNCKLLIEHKAGAIYARIRALYEAQFSWLLICDDDNILDRHFICNALEYISKHNNVGALGGIGHALLTKEQPTWFNKYASSYAVGNQNKESGELLNIFPSLYGAGTLFNTKALRFAYDNGFKNLMIGPNKKKLTRGEDTEWCYMLKLLGFSIHYCSELNFKHKISDERLSWNYYCNLKKGIASGIGLLECYRYLLLKANSSSLLSFSIYYFKNAIHVLFVFIKCWFTNSNKNEGKLVKIIYKAKLLSYIISYKQSLLQLKLVHKIKLKK